MITIVTDQHPGESDILVGLEMAPLHVKSSSGLSLLLLVPDVPWTDEKLQNLPFSKILGEKALKEGADVYLGDEWIGGTEV